MYDFYSNALEFFVEHGIQLTENQLISLKEVKHQAAAIYLNRTIPNKMDEKLSYSEIEDLQIGLRKVDLERSKLKKGKISKEDFEKNFEKIKNSYPNKIKNLISKEGSGVIDKYLGSRSNKSYVDIKPKFAKNNKIYANDISYSQKIDKDKTLGNKNEINAISRYFKGYNDKEGIQKEKDLTEKLKRHAVQAWDTMKERPKEAVQHGKQILKHTGLKDKSSRADVDINFNNNDHPVITKTIPSERFNDTDKYKDKKSNNLTHKSNQDKLTYLTPTGGSKEGIIYGTTKIFGYDKNADKSYSNYRSEGNKNHKYIIDKDDLNKKATYIGQDSDSAAKENSMDSSRKEISNIRMDTGSRSIESKDKIKVKQIE